MICQCTAAAFKIICASAQKGYSLFVQPYSSSLITLARQQAKEEQLNGLVEHLTVQHAGSPSAGILDPKASLSHLRKYSFASGAMYQRAPACRSPIRGHAVCTFS